MQKGHLLRVILIFATLGVVAATVAILLLRSVPSTEKVAGAQSTIVVEGSTEYANDTVTTDNSTDGVTITMPEEKSGQQVKQSSGEETSTEQYSSSEGTSVTKSAKKSADLEKLMRDIAENTKEEN